MSCRCRHAQRCRHYECSSLRKRSRELLLIVFENPKTSTLNVGYGSGDRRKREFENGEWEIPSSKTGRRNFEIGKSCIGNSESGNLKLDCRPASGCSPER